MGPTRSPRACDSPDSTTMTPTPKHSEKRRANWRVAIQKRRNAEGEAFLHLRQELPVSQAFLKPLDRMGTLRVALCYVRLRTVLERLQLHKHKGLEGESLSLPSLLKSLGVTTDSLLPDDAFVIIMSTGGEIIYVSDNVTKSLHCEKHAILGNSLYDYVQELDHADLNQLLSIRQQEQIVPIGDQAYKTPRGSITVALRPASGSGQRIRISGKLFLTAGGSSAAEAETFFLGVVEPLSRLPHPSDHDFPFPHFTIVTMYDWACSADFRTLLYCSPDIFLGYSASDFPEGNNWSPFDVYHAEDLALVQADLRKLFAHGEHQFNPYRILAKRGGWAWFITQASTMTVQAREGDGSLAPVTYCVGRDFMISDVIHKDVILGTIQLGIQYNHQQKKSELVENVEEEEPPLTPTDPFLLEEDVDIDELVRLVNEYDTEGSFDELLASFEVAAANQNFQNYACDQKLQLQLPKMVIDPHPELSALFVQNE